MLCREMIHTQDGMLDAPRARGKFRETLSPFVGKRGYIFFFEFSRNIILTPVNHIMSAAKRNERSTAKQNENEKMQRPLDYQGPHFKAS